MLHPSERREALRGGRNRRGDRNRFRPCVEELETRIVPAILEPMDVRHAYGFDQVTFHAGNRTVAGDGSGQTIAIVDAYNDPNIFGDVNTFDQTFSINNKQTIFNQYGAASRFLTQATPEGKPGTDPSGTWELEEALDVEWAHAIAPGAKILLVEAKSDSYTDLLGAVDYARSQPGVVVVSMSWGSVEFQGENTLDSHFTTPAGHLGGSNGVGGKDLPGGVTFLAASGDTGAPAGYPGTSPNVISVGGTSLTLTASGNYQGEVGWSGSGGGISRFESKPAFQRSATNSGMRTNPDVSFNADPNTGGYVYDSFQLDGVVGPWYQVGGTSAATPQWAALIAIADQGRALAGQGSLDGPRQTLPALYNLPSQDFHDITSGTNGYKAGPGYDLVTGRGSPVANRVIAALVTVNSQGSLPAPPPIKSSGKSGSAHPNVLFVAVPEPETPSGPASVATAGPDLVDGLLKGGAQSQVIVSLVSGTVRVTAETVKPGVAPQAVLTTAPGEHGTARADSAEATVSGLGEDPDAVVLQPWPMMISPAVAPQKPEALGLTSQTELSPTALLLERARDAYFAAYAQTALPQAVTAEPERTSLAAVLAVALVLSGTWGAARRRAEETSERPQVK